MGSPPLSYETLQETLEAVQRLGSQNAAAKALGISRSTLQNRMEIAARRGLIGTMGPAAADGFAVASTTTLRRLDPETGAVTSVLEWRRDRSEPSPVDLAHVLKDALLEVEGLAYLAPKPAETLPELATVYMLADLHLGMLAWAPETGDDYDLPIAANLLTKAMGDLVARSPDSDVGVILNLGDFFHADNDEQRTKRSGNKLSVDGRYYKVLKIGMRLMIYCIDLAKQKHARVLVRNIPGNHDPDASKALQMALWAYYRDDAAVEIVEDPSPFWVWRWGHTLLAASHGDGVKPDKFPGTVAARYAELWGRTQHRYALFGHVHHRARGGELGGMVWESFQTLAGKDDYHALHGYASGRSMVSVTYSKASGEWARAISPVGGGA
jgi:hypothetical protein